MTPKLTDSEQVTQHIEQLEPTLAKAVHACES
jgi:hypothetical protein